MDTVSDEMTEPLHVEEQILDSEIADDSEGETETEEEKLSVVVTETGISQKNDQQAKRKRKCKPPNFNTKGKVLWKMNFRKHKKNFELLDPNIPRKKQLNKMWSEMDQVEKSKWMKEAEVKYGKKREDLKNRAAAASLRKISRQLEKSEQDVKAKDEKNSPDSEKEVSDLKTEADELSSAIPGPSRPVFQKKERLFSKRGNLINMNKQGRMLWKDNFRADKKNMGHLWPGVRQKNQLNEMWSELDESEKLEWMNKAELQIRNKQEALKNGLRLPRGKNLRKLVQYENREVESGSVLSIQELHVTEPLKINLGDKGKQLWKMHFPKKNLDKSIRRKIQLDSVWSNLSPEDKSAWMAEAEFLLRSPLKKLVKILLPTPRIPWSNNYFPNLSNGKSLDN